MGLKAVSRTIAGAADYETGTWTPVLEGSTVAGSHGYANQGGVYLKAGHLVWATGIIALSSFDPSTSGSIYISGLPYVGSPGSHNSSAYSFARFKNVNLDTANGYLFATLTLPDQVDYLQIVQFGDDVLDKSVTSADLSSATAMRFTGSYVSGLPSAGP